MSGGPPAASGDPLAGPEPGAPTVDARGVSHSFGAGEARKQVLFDVRLALHPGEVAILTGPSGSGKTTLLTLLGALRAVQEGSLRVLGRELRGLGDDERVEVRRGIGFIFQTHNLFDSLTAAQNVLMAVELRRPPPPDRRALAARMLERVGLGDRADSRPRSLSVGQRQRVAIARALVNRPRLILADEPTAALDRESGQAVVRLLHDLARAERCVVLLVTHDPRVLEAADRIVNLVDGRVASDVRVARSVEICEFLARTSIFAGHTPASLTEVAEQMNIDRFAGGEVIFRQGDPGDRFYLIRRGRVQVLRGDEGARLVATLGPGEFFGEAALIEDKPRNATLRAVEDVELFSLTKAQFRTALAASRSFREQLLEVLLQRRP
jgi:putative ABC transport system ATP-binding protein